uniref:Uncharacterized protein n=1 Tax=Chloropicon primus TaxID=1764295 RepID=A0A7S2WYW7_9CHLO
MLLAASYLHFPPAMSNLAFAVYLGTGIFTRHLIAISFDAYRLLIVTLTSILLLPTSLMLGKTLKGMWRFSLALYFMSWNSPSGGVKVTILSELNLVKFTH